MTLIHRWLNLRMRHHAAAGFAATVCNWLMYQSGDEGRMMPLVVAALCTAALAVQIAFGWDRFIDRERGWRV